MRQTLLIVIVMATGLLACEGPARDCKQFQEGTFRFTAEVDGIAQTTVFTRTKDLEISEFMGKTDSASIRWINDCEYVLTNLNPKTRAEEKPIHMKILSTSGDSYTFEYKLVGSSKSSLGTAHRVE